MSNYDDDRGSVPSASGVYRIAHCPGSFLYERLFREAGEKYDGEFMHEVIVGDSPFEDCTLSQKEVILKGRRQRQEIIDVTIGSYNTAESLREQRLWLHDGPTPLLSGRFDEWLVNGKSALLTDFKFGWLEVTPADMNLQLRTLAVLAWKKFGIEDIFAAIIPPRLGIPTVVRYDLKTLEQSEVEVRGHAKKSLIPGQKKCAGDWCNYCKGRHVCAEAWLQGGVKEVEIAA